MIAGLSKADLRRSGGTRESTFCDGLVRDNTSLPNRASAVAETRP